MEDHSRIPAISTPTKALKIPTDLFITGIPPVVVVRLAPLAPCPNPREAELPAAGSTVVWHCVVGTASCCSFFGKTPHPGIDLQGLPGLPVKESRKHVVGAIKSVPHCSENSEFRQKIGSNRLLKT